MTMSAMTLTLFLLLAQIVGSEFTYTAISGDSLTSVGARFGVDVSVLAETNQLKPSALLKEGQTLRIDNRHIVPDGPEGAIVLNVPQRMLFLFDDGSLLGHYPVSVGSAGWKTPIGTFSVAIVEENPTWDVPVSIQEEMRREGKAVITRVLPGPSNPLGKYWIGLSLPGVGIHGTNAPNSIYKAVTHGCIRLHPEDIQDLAARVSIGDKVHIIYEPVLLTKAGDSVFLEVHLDVYRRNAKAIERVREVARAMGVENLIDWAKTENVIRKQEGIAREVTARIAQPGSELSD